MAPEQAISGSVFRSEDHLHDHRASTWDLFFTAGPISPLGDTSSTLGKIARQRNTTQDVWQELRRTIEDY